MPDSLSRRQIVPFLLSVIASGERLTAEEIAEIRALDAGPRSEEAPEGFYVSAPALADALYLALGWSTARYNPSRASGHEDWRTYDPIPDGIVSGDPDHADWTRLTTAVLRHLDAARRAALRTTEETP